MTMPETAKSGYNCLAIMAASRGRPPWRGRQLDARTAAVIQDFEARVAEAVREAYLALFDLGLDDAQIVALLGLPASMARQARTRAQQAA